MKKRTPRKRQLRQQQPLPGTTHVNMQLPKALADKMRAIKKARHKIEGADPKLCRIYREAVEQYIESIDIETGLRKPALPASGQSGPGIVAALPLFDQYVDCGRLDDADLIREMNKSWMMLWAAGPDNENLHVSPMLQLYTGRAAIEFRDLNWIEIIHPEDRERTMAICKEHFRTRQPYRQVYRMRRHDGLYGGIIDHAQPRLRPDGSFAGYIGTAYEVARPGMSVGILIYDHARWTSDESLIVPAGPPGVRR